MLLLLGGVVLFVGAVAMVWHFKPHEGQVHPMITMPVFQSAIPITITTVAALGLAMIVAGALN